MRANRKLFFFCMGYLAIGHWPFFSLPAARALGPHEVALLVNSRSERSLEIANHYARLRNIPALNILDVELPDTVLEPGAALTPEEFNRLIAEPVALEITRRGIADHIQAWVYSADFPLRITNDPPVSLTGITFVRGRLPESELIRKGAWGSLVFRGPDQPGGSALPPATIEQFAARAGENMPRPAMVLTHMGARGLTLEQSLRLLTRSAGADGARPAGAFYYLVNTDIRSTCRDWQFAGARDELGKMGFKATVGESVPAGAAVVGLLMGSPYINPADYGTLAPGAVAGHLTSWGGIFESPYHTKLTAWLLAGAAGSDGTVTEPYAIWTKFPNGRLFVHYAAGCTLLESYYQAIRCPLQTVLVGDPLTAPWAPRASLVLVGLDDAPVGGRLAFSAQLLPPVKPEPNYMFLLDGRVLTTPFTGDIKLDTDALGDGWHELRCVAYLPGALRSQFQAAREFTLSRFARQVVFDNLEPGARIDLRHPLRLKISAAGQPQTVGVICGARLLGEVEHLIGGAELTVDPAVAGAGPVRLQPFALYGSNELVRGAPVPVEILRLDQPPAIAGISVETNAETQLALTAAVADPEGDPVRLDWFQPVATGVAHQVWGGACDWADGSWVFAPPANEMGVVEFADYPLRDRRSVTARISIERDAPDLNTQKAGLIYQYTDPDNFHYFGIWGDTGAWVLGARENGAWRQIQARGLPIEPDRPYAVDILQTETGLEFRVDGERLFAVPGEQFGAGPLALAAGAKPARFAGLAVSPPIKPPGACAVDAAGRLLVTPPAGGLNLILRASDSWRYAEQPVDVPGP